jgi:hypothetical protein
MHIKLQTELSLMSIVQLGVPLITYGPIGYGNLPGLMCRLQVKCCFGRKV